MKVFGSTTSLCVIAVAQIWQKVCQMAALIYGIPSFEEFFENLKKSHLGKQVCFLDNWFSNGLDHVVLQSSGFLRRPQKFDKISQFLWRLLRKHVKTFQISSNICELKFNHFWPQALLLWSWKKESCCSMELAVLIIVMLFLMYISLYFFQIACTMVDLYGC